MTGAEELQKEITSHTLAFVGIIFALGFGAGAMITELRSQSKLLEVRYQMAIEEIQGLRSDVYREDAHIWKAIDEMKK